MKNNALTLAAAHAEDSFVANPRNPGALVLSTYMGLCKKPQDMDTTDRELDAYIEGYPKDHPDVPRQMRYCQLMLIDQGLLPGGNGSVYKDWGGRETILDAIRGLPDGDYRKGRGYVLLAIRDFFQGDLGWCQRTSFASGSTPIRKETRSIPVTVQVASEGYCL